MRSALLGTESYGKRDRNGQTPYQLQIIVPWKWWRQSARRWDCMHRTTQMISYFPAGLIMLSFCVSMEKSSRTKHGVVRAGLATPR